jgi:hypothetical protein
MKAELARPSYEPADAETRVVGLIGAGLATLIALGLLVGWAFLGARHQAVPAEVPADAAFQDGSSYRTSIDVAWAGYQRDVREHLVGYGWVDRPAGIVHVPIERAIDLVCAPGPSGTPPP